MSHFTRGEKDYRKLVILYALVGKPAEAVAAFEAAEAAEYLNAAVAAVHVARAYVALGRCAHVERITTKLERRLGGKGPARELRVILSTCSARSSAVTLIARRP